MVLRVCAVAASMTAAAAVLAGCGAAAASENTAVVTTSIAPVPSAAPAPVAVTTPALPQQLPGLGPAMLAQIPANTDQAVIVTGTSINSSSSHAVLYERTAAGWQAGPVWPTHNGDLGWSANEYEGNLRTPIGVFGLTDAGGLLADPGSKLPYTQSTGFTIGGTGFEGESLAGSFNYVVAINYNRQPGTSPLNWTRPLGDAKGGGIWFHVDHGGPTHGCVSLPAADMLTLLHTLDPARHPVVVMGDAASLAR